MISDIRENVYYRDNGKCQVCGCVGNMDELQLAHIISKGKSGQRHCKELLKNMYNVFITNKQAELILNSEECFKLACPGNCNDSVNAFFKTVESDNLIIEIATRLGFVG